jgi:hypothetical protein
VARHRPAGGRRGCAPGALHPSSSSLPRTLSSLPLPPCMTLLRLEWPFSTSIDHSVPRMTLLHLFQVRFPIRDFDPYDLRRKLPKAVARLAREHDPAKGTVYIHCTAGERPKHQSSPCIGAIQLTGCRGASRGSNLPCGSPHNHPPSSLPSSSPWPPLPLAITHLPLPRPSSLSRRSPPSSGLGRAPASALAYMTWVRGMQVDEAMENLTSIRRCSPKIESIR